MKRIILSVVMVFAIFTGSPSIEKPNNISIIMYEHGTDS